MPTDPTDRPSPDHLATAQHAFVVSGGQERDPRLEDQPADDDHPTNEPELLGFNTDGSPRYDDDRIWY